MASSPADLSKVLNLQVLFETLHWDPVLRDVCHMWRDYYDANVPSLPVSVETTRTYIPAVGMFETQVFLRVKAQRARPFQVIEERGPAPPPPRSRWKSDLTNDDRKKIALAQKQIQRRKR